MSDEDIKLLEAVRNWQPPEELHPIAMVAWHLYEGHGNQLPPEAVQDLRDTLDGYGEDVAGLAGAMEGLVRFMLYVGDELGDQESGQKVTDLMREYEERFEPFWRRVAEALQNVGEGTRASFQQFLDARDAGGKSAPVFGQKAPAGSVPLRDLAPPARPPPWAPKKR